MNKIIAVIGAGYGDEGKGLMTDYHVRQLHDPIVVRANSGAQAGHTVNTPDGQRHVFSHFSSGTFAGAETLLSEFFVLNPILFKQEHEEFISKFNIIPKIYVHPYCQMTTPYEMIGNQALEMNRQSLLHGSCGVGFGETLERVELVPDVNFIAASVFNKTREDIIADLVQIRKWYIQCRVEVELSAELSEVYSNDTLIDDYCDAIEYMKEHITIVFHSDPYNRLNDRDVVFENAQGLALDQQYGFFPHVTRSNTGLKNIVHILQKCKNDAELIVNYVTRAYTTRHGAGPLAHEEQMPDWVVDKTNITGKWQGKLRYAPLDIRFVRSHMERDVALNRHSILKQRSFKHMRTITCCDQLPNGLMSIAHEGVAVQDIDPVNFGFDLYSYGPTHKDITKRV